MSDRRARTHARFILPHLSAGMDVLDLGCGPGTIILGLAAAVAPGCADAVAAAGHVAEAQRLRAWAHAPGAVFAVRWINASAQRP